MTRMRHCFVTFCAVLLSAFPAFALSDAVNLSNPMAADLSQTAIEIRSNFNGTQMLVFGAQNIPGDLVIALRGPKAKVMLRRKERIAGMWMQVEQKKYLNLPVFYALTSNKPLAQIISPATQELLEFGTDYLAQHSNPETTPIFTEALDRRMRNRKLWQPAFGDITYFGESLFKARMNLPDNLPGGEYSAEIYLFEGGTLRAMQAISLHVYKKGFEADLFAHSRNHGFWYGIVAILIALSGGWIAQRLFHRD